MQSKLFLSAYPILSSTLLSRIYFLFVPPNLFVRTRYFVRIVHEIVELTGLMDSTMEKAVVVYLNYLIFN